VWESDTGNVLIEQWPMPEFAVQMALSSDGRRGVAYGRRTAQIWDLASGEAISPLLTHTDNVRGVMFSPDDERVAIRSQTELTVWTVTGQEAFPPLSFPVGLAHAEFSPDSACLVTTCSDPALSRGFAQVWNAATGEKIGVPMKHRDGVGFACFSPNGRRIVTMSEDFTAMVWDSATGRPIGAALQHEGQVHGAAFSPDSRWVVTGSRDQTVRLWNAETGDPLMPPLRHDSVVTRVRFLPDGSGVATVTARNEVRIWSLPVDPRPTDDLALLAQFLSGQSAISAGSWGANELEPLDNLWLHLRNKYPDAFAVTRQEIAGWHNAQAEASEAAGNWRAAAFHLKQLQTMQAGDAALAARLERAIERMNPRN
jgi:WD40 repeat protein